MTTNAVKVFIPLLLNTFQTFQTGFFKLKPKPQNTFQPKILSVLLRRRQGQLCPDREGKACTPNSAFGNLELQSWLFK